MSYIIVVAVAILVAGAECLHLKRARATELLTYGPNPKNGTLSVYLAALFRVLFMTGLAWALLTLLMIPAKNHSKKVGIIEPEDRKHLLLILDVSPSMRLQDAGGGIDNSRTKRAAALVQSLLKRITDENLHISMVAVYNGAKPVVQESRDTEVILNFLDGLPLSSVFPTGKTKLFDGLKEAAKIAEPWPNDSATVLLVSDGDTVPATGMPKMPPSVSGVLVLGVGNPTRGSMIDGRQSRQDVGALRQIAARLGGEYHDGNLKHIPTQMLSELGAIRADDDGFELTQREFALATAVISAVGLALLPFILNLIGTQFSPGVKPSRS